MTSTTSSGFDPITDGWTPDPESGPPDDWGGAATYLPDDGRLADPPIRVRSRPITGNGMYAIRDWVCAVEAHFGGQNMATCYYAALIGYHAHLRNFTVEVTDRELARVTGMHRSRLSGHAQRLVDSGFLFVEREAKRGRAARYRLGVPDVTRADDSEVPF